MITGRDRPPLVPLFFVSLVSIGFEISLTRYFAVASWSEYGYWVISIALAGIAASGVVLSLFHDTLTKYKERLLLWMPAALMLCAAVGFYFATINPFNPLQLQNPELWRSELWNIGKYYLALSPFFFLAGSYVGLYFVSFPQHIPRVYGADLAGAGTGGLVTLGLMYWLHPFYLLAALIPILLLADYLSLRSAARRTARRLLILFLAVFVGSEYVVAVNRATFGEYKSIFAGLHVPGSRVLDTTQSPRGLFTVVEDFTERLDTDFSNNAQLLKVPDPPATRGLYKDGDRLTSLPKTAAVAPGYIRGALDAFPYSIESGGSVLLIGTRGGFRVPEALYLGASRVLALESDPMIFDFATRQGQAGRNPRVQWVQSSPFVVARTHQGMFDLVDIASDFLPQSDTNRYVFTVDGLQALLGMLNEHGVLSIPVSIREVTVYAIKVLETARRALAASGTVSPQTHLAVYRSAWNARLLVFKRPLTLPQVAALRAFCDARSFDLSYYAGINPDKVAIYNDLPEVSFENETFSSNSQRASDALMVEAIALFKAPAPAASTFFNIEPSTYNRPFLFSVLKLENVGRVLPKVALIPREEIAFLVNVAVVLQAALVAVIVLGLPLVRWRARLPAPRMIVKTVLYFASLGLGFLFLEILLIEKVAFFLNDRTQAFALVVTTMLLCSGLGSFGAMRYRTVPRAGVARAATAVCVWSALAVLLLDGPMRGALAWPLAGKAGVVVGIVAPLAIALGMPFPLGLTAFDGELRNLLPWAWSVNGAFSVISTPLANLLAITSGYRVLLLVAFLLYASLVLTFPVRSGGVEG